MKPCFTSSQNLSLRSHFQILISVICNWSHWRKQNIVFLFDLKELKRMWVDREMKTPCFLSNEDWNDLDIWWGQQKSFQWTSLQWGQLYKGRGINWGHQMEFLECQAEKLKLETLAMWSQEQKEFEKCIVRQCFYFHCPFWWHEAFQ